MLEPRYLLINLSTNKINNYKIPKKYCKIYIGGKALAARLLFDIVPKGINAFHKDNALIINTGPLTGTGAPSTSRFNITTKNVLTGGIASSNSGGNFGIKLRKAGYDGLIVTGAAQSPVYIEITKGKGKIKPAENLWGLDTEKTQKKLPKSHGKIVIGPAGENLVHFASIVSQERASARTGVGAVMGSKKLKAITVFGNKKIPVANEKKFKPFIKKWISRIKSNYVTGKFLPKHGTLWLSKKAFEKKLYPVKNFTGHEFKGSEKLTGEYFAENFNKKNSGCVSCPIKCTRRTIYKGMEIKGPEFETTGALGSNILNNDFKKIIAWNYLADLLGMDTISLGATLAFAMELKEKGLADFDLSFGKFNTIEKTIHDIATRTGHGNELANGIKWLSKKYGGKDFAMHVKGLELPAFNPKKAQAMGLGYITSNRGGCHLNGGYLAFLEGLGPLYINHKSLKTKASITVLFQNILEAISSCGICLFTLFIIFPNFMFRKKPFKILLKIISFLFSHSNIIIKQILKHNSVLKLNIPIFPYPTALEYVTGIKMDIGRFLNYGETIYNLERMFNIREGITDKDDKLCIRGIHYENKNKENLSEMLKMYYKLRGWDKYGKPRKKKLLRLGIKLQ